MAKKKRCFVIMPFGEERTLHLSLYHIMIKPIVDEYGYFVVWDDEFTQLQSDDYNRDSIKLLYESDLVIADLTGQSPNVFYELGMRHVFCRSGTILIIRKGETLPFKISNYPHLFYSTELDSIEEFKKELQQRIEELERFEKSDNPVHDTYVPIKIHKEKVNRGAQLKEEVKTLRKENEEAKGKLEAILKEKADLEKRIEELEKKIPKIKLSYDEVKKVLKERDFFDKYKNEQGKGLKHQYEVVKREGEKLVIDHATGLTWQQSGSSNYMTFDDALNYIKQLNDRRFAGYNDWHLPTLEEAMSLMERKEYGDLYIDKRFDHLQRWIWTADKKSGSGVWVVHFSGGLCFNAPVGLSYFVRAVR